ncbi:MAG: histidine kinase [Bacteroidota bacterium]|nr:histidine kinase [Bacteroidota bacterium]
MSRIKLYTFLFVLSAIALNSQTRSTPVVKFLFNNKSDLDESNKLKAKLVGINFTTDRFGNDNNAIFFSGNAGSYVNLGTSKLLKQRAGSISLWLKIEHPVMSGTGAKYNPIIITKCNPSSDFYESYALYYMLDSKKIVAVCAKDSTRDIGIFSKNTSWQNKWQHLVMTYNDERMSFYVDGQLQDAFPKNFETKFLEGDSVLVGLTGNKKNNRWLIGSVDEIAFYEKVLTPAEIQELYNAPDPNTNKIIINRILICLSILTLAIALYFLIKYKFKIAVQKEKARLELNNKLLETELRVNRALMNPHFIFNSLNTLNHYILTNNNEIASDYLVKFSKLIRKILDSNMSDTISLEQEIELIHGYLEIEGLRFKEDIKYELNIDPAIISSSVIIPIMMIQPFIENSVWHGLRDKTGDKIIRISFSLLDNNYIECTIDDNGTGRKKKEPNPLEKKSLATGFVIQRLELLNKIHNLNCSLTIADKENGAGTIVKIILPILNK